jgi:hypothetical protein
VLPEEATDRSQALVAHLFWRVHHVVATNVQLGECGEPVGVGEHVRELGDVVPCHPGRDMTRVGVRMG